MSRNKIFVLSLLLMLILCGIILFGKNIVFHPDELAYENKFKSINVGMNESDVYKLLGGPDRIILSDPTTQQLLYIDKGMKHYAPLEIDARTKKPRYYPPANDVFPDRRIASRVMIYTLGTVTAYYFIGLNSKVDYFFVWIS